MTYEYRPKGRALYLEARVFKGKSLRELERDSEVDRAVLSRWLRGKGTVTVGTARKVARCLGVSVERLMRELELRDEVPR